MDLESIAGGGGAGIIGTILVAIGFGRRLNKVEDDKQDKTVCTATHEFIKTQFTDLKEGQKEIFEQLKGINHTLRNSK